MEKARCNGIPVYIRELCSDDKEELKKGFESLSKQSILYRFNDPIKRLTTQQLKYLTEIDNVNHAALGAHVIVDGKELGIGVARYIRTFEGADSAEFALTVIDAYQNMGIGTLLLEHIIQKARKCGIRKLIGYIRDDNVYMRSLVEKRKCVIRKEGGNLLRADIDCSA